MIYRRRGIPQLCHTLRPTVVSQSHLTRRATSPVLPPTTASSPYTAFVCAHNRTSLGNVMCSHVTQLAPRATLRIPAKTTLPRKLSTRAPSVDPASVPEPVADPVAEPVEQLQAPALPLELPPHVSFYRRQLPAPLIHLNSQEGRRMFAEALGAGTMELYFPLAEHFVTQAEPSYCALSTLVMCMNAMSVDPGVVWRWPWRWAHEDVLCRCLPREPVLREGITFQQFLRLARCHGLHPEPHYAEQGDIHAFRAAVRRLAVQPSAVAEGFASDSCGGVLGGPEHAPRPADAPAHHCFQFVAHNTNVRMPTQPAAAAVVGERGQAIVGAADANTVTDAVGGAGGVVGVDARGGLRECIAVSFSRKALGQTGDGHMSPLAGYHEGRDAVLVLDVARFKYPPYWVRVEDLWAAMLPADRVSGRSRGWCALSVGGTPRCRSDARDHDHGDGHNLAPSHAQGDASARTS